MSSSKSAKLSTRWILAGSLLLLGSIAAAQGGSSETVLAAADVGSASAEAASADLALEPAELWVQANAAYDEGLYGRAIALYERLVDEGMASGGLFYNLGNAYLRGGDLGRAIASYRRAQVFLPRDQDIEANLRFARSSTKDALAPPEPHPIVSTLFFWHHGMSRGELGTLFLILNLLFWGVLGLRLYRPGSELLRWATFGLLLFLLGTGGSLLVHYLAPTEVAVILPGEIEARSGTSPSDVVLFKLQAGAEVRVVDRREGALRIALPRNGEPADGQGDGWISAADAAVVRR